MTQEAAGFRQRSASDCDEFVFYSPPPSNTISLIHPDDLLQDLDEELFAHMDEDPLELFDMHSQESADSLPRKSRPAMVPKEFNAETPAWKFKVPVSIRQDCETAEKLILEGIFDTSREVYDEDYERKQDEKNKLTFGK